MIKIRGFCSVFRRVFCHNSYIFARRLNFREGRNAPDFLINALEIILNERRMVRLLFPAITGLLLMSSCSTLRTIPFSSNKQMAAVQQPPTSTRFIEEIAVSPAPYTENVKPKSGPAAPAPEKVKAPVVKTANLEPAPVPAVSMSPAKPVLSAVEVAAPVQFKYAVLMNTEVEYLPSRELLEAVDEWYGVRYRSGGNTRNGVDCSGFTVAVYAAVYGMTLPRVSRDQYHLSRKISTTELQEGDLLFFNTNGRGVSHVGIYLGNNKFIHASVSKGVMVNDLFETYYIKRFIGAGRIENKTLLSSQN